MNKPTLAVVMPNYNHARYLPEALDRVRSQSWSPDEIIVVDDASTDNSVEIVTRLAEQDARIRLVRNERNLGAVSALNRAVDEARSDYLCPHAADDRMLEGHLEKGMKALAEHPHAGLSFSLPGFFYDGSDRVIHDEALVLPSKSPRYYSPSESADVIGPESLWPHGHTAILKRSSTLAAGKFLPDIRWYCDTFLMVVIAFREGFCFVPDVTAAFRVSSRSYSNRGVRMLSARQGVLWEIVRVLRSPDFADVKPLFERSRYFDYFPAYRELLLASLRSGLGRPTSFDRRLAEIGGIIAGMIWQLERDRRVKRLIKPLRRWGTGIWSRVQRRRLR